MAQTLGFDSVQAPAVETAAAERRSLLASPRALFTLSSALLVCVLVVIPGDHFSAFGPASALWAASAVAVAGWLNGPRGREFDLAFGLLATAAFAIGRLLVGDGLAEAAGLTFANMVEVVSAVAIIKRFTPATQPLTASSLIKYLVLAPIVAPLLSGVIATAALSRELHAGFWDLLSAWWLGHGLGLAVIGPLGLHLAQTDFRRRPSLLKIAEAVLILAAMTFVSLMVFFYPQRPAGFMVMPLLLLAAARLRLPGATAALLIVAVLSLSAIVAGHSSTAFAHDALASKIRLMQLYLIFAALPALPMAALLDERDRLATAAQAGQRSAEAASAGKSRLLANVSHEIKSPVAGIIGIGELWSAGRLGPVTPMQQEMAEMLTRTARQVEALAYDLLDVAQAEAGTVTVRLGPVEVGGLLEDVRRTVSMKPEAHALRILVERGAEELRAMADSVRLTQVVTNLATNAVKYGGSGGVVILRVERLPAERVRIAVIDKGPGIPLEKQSQLFEPFNRLGMEKTTIEGNGIGLTLARRLTELQGGAIGFESRPGEGSLFWIELPAVA
jgi:signal transduction histidine kinase